MRAAERSWACVWCKRRVRASVLKRHEMTHYCRRCERFHTQRGFDLHHGTAAAFVAAVRGL